MVIHKLERRLDGMDHRHQQTMNFLSTVLQNPSVLSQLLQTHGPSQLTGQHSLPFYISPHLNRLQLQAAILEDILSARRKDAHVHSSICKLYCAMRRICLSCIVYNGFEPGLLVMMKAYNATNSRHQQAKEGSVFHCLDGCNHLAGDMTG